MYNRQQLSEMLDDLRAESGHSLVVAHGVNQEETLKYLLRRTQRELYAAHDWPYLVADTRVSYAKDQRYVPIGTTINYEKINQMWCAVGSDWEPVAYGINPAQYSLYNPDAGQVGWPVRAYRPDPVTDSIELWPVPSQDGELLIRGALALQPLVQLNDRSTLDGQLLVMFAAADMLARQRDEDAGLKLNKARQYLTSLQKQYGSNKRKAFSLAPADGGRRPRVGIDYIPRGFQN